MSLTRHHCSCLYTAHGFIDMTSSFDERYPYPRHGGGFHRLGKILGHNGEWFGAQEGLLYHFILKRKKKIFKIFLKNAVKSHKIGIFDSFFLF